MEEPSRKPSEEPSKKPSQKQETTMARAGAQDFFPTPESDNHVLDTASSTASPDDNSLRDYIMYADDDTLSIPSLSNHAFIDSEDDDTSCATAISIASEKSMATGKSEASERESINGDLLPKSFLQLKGIFVGNFNMNCNFKVDHAIEIMIHYNLSILAVQEHTPWNRELSIAEIASIHKHCDGLGYFATICKLQILIIDKQLYACHRETNVFEEGRVMQCRFEIAEKQYVTFAPVYGIPHSSAKNATYQPADTGITGENKKLELMTNVQRHIKAIINSAITKSDYLY